MPKIPNEKHERFCQEIHVDLNRIEAVIRTGCWYDTDPETGRKLGPLLPDNKKHRAKASAIASRLMLDPIVICRVNELEAQRNHYVHLDGKRILERIMHVAFDFEPEDGPGWKDIVQALKELAKFDGTLYAADNQQRADAVGTMFKQIFDTTDGLPKNGRSDPDTQDSAETGG